MRGRLVGKALIGWGLLVGALAVASLISIGLYNWDVNARQEEASLRPQPLAPLAALPPTPTPIAVLTVGSAPAPVAPGDATAGKATFLKTCFGCHPNGNAAIGPALYGAAFSARYPDNAAIEAVIRGGRGRMPAFASSQLADDDLANIIAYLRSL